MKRRGHQNVVSFDSDSGQKKAGALSKDLPVVLKLENQFLNK